MIFRYPIAAVGAFALMSVSACATSPVSDGPMAEASSVQPGVEALTTKRPGTGEVVVKRDAGGFGAACASRLFVDGSPVASLRQGQGITLYLPTLPSILSVRPACVCAGGTYEVSVTPRADKASRFRIGYGTNGDYFIVATAF